MNAVRSAAVTTIGVVHNARSERNREGAREVHAALENRPGIVELDFDERTSLAEIAAELRRRAVGLVVVNGGDGTVQGLLTELLEGPREAPLPTVAILPRGMANMTAQDCGLASGKPAALHRLVAVARAGELKRHIVRRRVLRVENAVGVPPQRGMFFGAAGIFDAIRYCKSAVHTRGLKGEWANLTTLLHLLAGFVRGRTPPGMLEGENVTARIDGETRQGRELLLLATTLDRLVVGSRPFWNDAGKPLRYTALAYPPQHLLRNAWTVLWGKDRRRLPEPAYFSRGAERVELAMDGPFTIDGEYFRAEAARPLVLTAPDEVRFVRLRGRGAGDDDPLRARAA